MQNNPILTTLLVVLMTVVAVVLGFTFVQQYSFERKVVKLHDQVQTQDSSLAELRRAMETSLDGFKEQSQQSDDNLRSEIREARDAAVKTERQFDTLIKLAQKGLIGGGSGNGSSGASDTSVETEPDDKSANSTPSPARPRRTVNLKEDRNSKPSIIAGKEIYPYNAGWTVLCDSSAMEDPKRDRPPDDQIDFNAVLNDYVAGEPKGLNYYSDDRSTTVASLSYYINDFLAERKTSNVQEWNAKLAQRIEESPERDVYMIYLREGVRWHTPEPSMVEAHPFLKGEHFVTAKDIKFTLDLLRHEQTATPLKVYFQDIEKVEIVDDLTVRVTWSRPRFYNRASTLELQPIAEWIYAYDPDGNRYPESDLYASFGKHWFSTSMCGNGPYRFVEYARGEYIRCVRNNSYYLNRPTCKEYVVQIIRDNEARIAAFWNNRIIFTLFSAQQYRTFVLEGDDNRPVNEFAVHDRPAPGDWEHTYFIHRRATYGGFGWNQRKPLFSDKRVRRALTHALNREAVPEKYFYGLGETLAIGESVFSPYFNPNLPVLPFDLEEAARLMKESGWEDTDGDGVLDKVIDGSKVDFEFKLLISSSSPLQTQICQMYKEDLFKIGMKLVIDPAESALWSRQIHDREFDGFIIFWTAGFDTDPKQLWDSAKVNDVASNNYTGFANAEADEIFVKLETAFEYPERIALHHRWYEIQYELQPYTWIWSVHSAVVSNADWRIPAPRQNSPYLDRRLFFRWKDRP